MVDLLRTTGQQEGKFSTSLPVSHVSAAALHMLGCTILHPVGA